MHAFTLVEILLFLALMISSFGIWGQEILIDTSFIPTILNGLTSSISLAVGFTGAFVALAIRKPLSMVSRHRKRVGLTIVMLTLPIFVLFGAYSALMIANYYGAFRWAMTGVAMAFVILVDFLCFLVLEV